MKSALTGIKNSMQKRLFFSFILAVLSGLNLQLSYANTNNIEEINYTSLPGNRLQINIRLSEVTDKPLSFNIDNPARIAFDFNNTKSNLSKGKQQIGIGVAQSITAVSVKNKTRVILNLSETVPYTVAVHRNTVSITLESEASHATPASKGGLADITSTRERSTGKAVKKIDFRRGEKGEGRVLLHLTEASIPMDISEEFGKIVVNFSNTTLKLYPPGVSDR